MKMKPAPDLEPKTRVLVVDDDPVASRIAARVARFGGLEVRECQDPAEAVELARSWSPQLVISDVTMPGIDGTVLCVALKADPATKRVPILLVSAEEDFDQAWLGRFCGSADFLPKPFTPIQLLRRINRLLGRVDVDAK